MSGEPEQSARAASVPWVSIALVGMVAAVFWAEIAWPITPETRAFQPSVETLTWMGALNRRLVLEAGQMYRLVTAPFLHASLNHITGNCVALGFAGWLVERRVGHLWFAVLYAAGALAGDVGSMALNPPTVVSTGASGAIMALFAAVVALSLRPENAGERWSLLRGAGGILLPALVPVHSAAGAQQVDYGAHFGGALGGFLLALAILRPWRRSDALPNWRIAAAFVAIAVLCSAAALWVAVTTREAVAPIIEAKLIETLQRRGADDEAYGRADRLAREWPESRDAWLIYAGAAFNTLRMDEAAQAYATAAALGRGRTVRTHGIALLYAGRSSDAIDVLRKYTWEQSDDAYGAIWLAIARLRAGEPLGDLPRFGAQTWPSPVLRLLAGEITPDALAASARQLSPLPGEDYECEAVFYGAEWTFAHGDKSRALEGFRLAERRCPPAFVELTAARAELREPR